MSYKFFSLEEAQKLIPQLKKQLREANAELTEKQLALQAANDIYENTEQLVDKADGTGDIEAIRKARQRFETSIAALSQAQADYVECFHRWVNDITSTGVILRDLHAGLLDFPSRQDELIYFLCWRMDEDDINYWHLGSDGFAGRKPLSALAEYR